MLNKERENTKKLKLKLILSIAVGEQVAATTVRLMNIFKNVKTPCRRFKCVLLYCSKLHVCNDMDIEGHDYLFFQQRRVIDWSGLSPTCSDPQT